jgi:flagellar motility protein MotE (MotC chaperone)
MSIAKFALLGVGGATLFVGSFVGVALVSGKQAHEIPLLKNFSKSEPRHDDPVKTVAKQPEHAENAPEPKTGPKLETARHAPLSASVLGAFVMPAPFTSTELEEMQSKLRALNERAEKLVATLAKRQTELDERESALDGREKELQALKTELDRGMSELNMRHKEVANEQKADATTTAAAKDEKSWKEVVRFFEEGEPEELAKKLATFEPDEAAKILRGLEDERAIALVNALPMEKYKPVLEAYRKAPK